MTTSLAGLPEAPSGSGIVYRMYRGLDDIPGMGDANARLRAHSGALEPIDLDGMRHRYTHLVNSDPALDCVVVERDGAIVGYGRAEWHDLADGDRLYDATLIVEPSAWALGITDAILGWCEGRLAELAAEHPTGRTEWLSLGTWDRDDEASAVYAAHGYAAVRWDVEMLRPDLSDIPEVRIADGYTVRTPTRDELPAVFEMNVQAFDEHWGQYDAADQRIEGWIDSPAFRLDLTVVAWNGDRPAACVSNVLTEAPDGSVRGLLNGVATHPDHRRRGLARACIAESLRRLRDAGATSAYLSVDTDNRNRALALYESCGFRVSSSNTTYRKRFRPPEAPG
jgi:ribosomal protein S18 acetylase RimI-like enzyme